MLLEGDRWLPFSTGKMLKQFRDSIRASIWCTTYKTTSQHKNKQVFPRKCFIKNIYIFWEINTQFTMRGLFGAHQSKLPIVYQIATPSFVLGFPWISGALLKSYGKLLEAVLTLPRSPVAWHEPTRSTIKITESRNWISKINTLGLPHHDLQIANSLASKTLFTQLRQAVKCLLFSSSSHFVKP